MSELPIRSNSLESVCVAEPYLSRKINSSMGFSGDLHLYRNQVAKGINTAATVLGYLLEDEPGGGSTIEAELKACFKNIEDGRCSIYKLENIIQNS